MGTPTRTMRIPDGEWDRWVGIAAHSIPTDGTSATTLYIRRAVNWVSDLAEQRTVTVSESGLVVPTPRERIVVASTKDKLTAELAADIRQRGNAGWEVEPGYSEPDWLKEYIPIGPPA